MATKEQFDFFKSKFDNEFEKSQLLTKRAEIYLSIVSFFLTGIVFKIIDITKFTSNNTIIKYSFIFCLISLLISSLIIVKSFILLKYSDSFYVEDWPDELEEEEQLNSVFFDNRIVDFIKATKKNRELNLKKGNQLRIASYFILVSIFCIGIFICFIVLL